MYELAVIVTTTSESVSITLRNMLKARLQNAGKTRLLKKKFPAPKGEFNGQFFFAPKEGKVDFSNQHWLSFLPAPSHTLSSDNHEEFKRKFKDALKEIPTSRPQILVWGFEFTDSNKRILHVQIYSKLIKD